jgi:hypothetical protein
MVKNIAAGRSMSAAEPGMLIYGECMKQSNTKKAVHAHELLLKPRQAALIIF